MFKQRELSLRQTFYKRQTEICSKLRDIKYCPYVNIQTKQVKE
jgi:hypothetical protein